MTKITYDGVRLWEKFTIGNLRRPLPEFRPSMSEVQGADGMLFDGVTLGTRTVSFDIVAIAKNVNALQSAARQIASIVSARKPLELIIHDERDDDGTQLVRYAVPTGTFDADEFRKLGKWHLSFVQPDPYLYGKHRSVVMAANVQKKIDAGGNAPAWPKAVSKPTGSSYTFEAVGGDHLTFKASFNGSRTLTLDASKQTAKLSGNLSSGDGLTVGSRFFPLEGKMTLTATRKTTVTWRERWI